MTIIINGCGSVTPWKCYTVAVSHCGSVTLWQCYTVAVSHFGYPTLSSHVAVSHFPLLTKFLTQIQILPHRLSCIRWPSSSSQYNICRHAATSDICALLVYLWHFLRKKDFPFSVLHLYNPHIIKALC